MKRICIIGGGLAGLASAERLLQELPDDVQIHLFERSRFLGGRAAVACTISTQQKTLDAAQHLTMGCCPAFVSFLERTGLRQYWQTQDHMAFFCRERGGKHSKRSGISILRNSRVLPKPLHLLGSLLRMRFLTLAERFNLARTLARFLLSPPPPRHVSLEEWLVQHHCASRVRRLFFDMVAVSAFCDLADDVPARLAQRVFCEMFHADKTAWHPILPTEPLRKIFNERLEPFLDQPIAQGRLQIHRSTSVSRVVFRSHSQVHLKLAGSSESLPAEPFPTEPLATEPLATASLATASLPSDIPAYVPECPSSCSPKGSSKLRANSPTRAHVRERLESWSCAETPPLHFADGAFPNPIAGMETDDLDIDRAIESHVQDPTSMNQSVEPVPSSAPRDSMEGSIPTDFDACILAVPWHTAGRIVPELISRRIVLEAFFEPRTIAAVHFWTKKPLFQGENLALPGSLIQWIFRHDFGDTSDGGLYYQALVSNSDECVTDDLHALHQLVLDELQTLFPQAEILDAHAVRFPGAVFSSQPEFSDSKRPSTRTPWPTLFLAGDWTATGLPGTMEGAVRSGNAAAQALLELLANAETREDRV